MTHVVTDACIGCRFTDCVSVCPVDCFHEGPNFLVIDPDGCIDCGVCIPECPVEAIYSDTDLPARMEPFLALNAELSLTWPVIVQVVPALPGAEALRDTTDKLALLET
jgi:Ferredoxin